MDSCNFTNKANSHALEVKIHTRQKLCHFGRYDAKAELFCQKSFVLVTGIPEAFELPAFDWPEKISEEEQPGDSDVLLHDVVFLVDRHSCVARSTRKISELMLTKPEKLQALTQLQETNALR